ncbi:MAG TPA: hypothetical protein VIV40_43510 [Kofleriaceae bacterium]
MLHAVAATLLLVGCVGSAQVRGSASVSAPELVYVSPGVQVIADYNEPIFYSDAYYWRYDGSVWYRSSNYTSGWVRFQAPAAVLRIERPSAYVHYRGHARATGTVVEAPRATPVTHDERNEMKAEQKEERKEQKAEQKEEHNEQKQERKDEHKDAKKGHR